MRYFLLLACVLTGFSAAAAVKEGNFCTSEVPGHQCEAGLACDRRGSEDPYGGICRKPCREDTDCGHHQVCSKDATVGFCVDHCAAY
ncbi:MAG: hypothetical protein V4534_07515 [Myxococcota bacterium]